jgi:hypothetical protein
MLGIIPNLNFRKRSDHIGLLLPISTSIPLLIEIYNVGELGGVLPCAQLRVRTLNTAACTIDIIAPPHWSSFPRSFFKKKHIVRPSYLEVRVYSCGNKGRAVLLCCGTQRSRSTAVGFSAATAPHRSGAQQRSGYCAAEHSSGLSTGQRRSSEKQRSSTAAGNSSVLHTAAQHSSASAQHSSGAQQHRTAAKQRNSTPAQQHSSPEAQQHSDAVAQERSST